MGNACSCMRFCSSSSLPQDVDLSAEFMNRLCNDFTKESVDQLISRMDQLIDNLNAGAQTQTHASSQQSSAPPSSAVSAATQPAREIVHKLCNCLERQIAQRKRCGKTNRATLKRCGRAALDNHTTKFVSEVLGKIENVPYAGMAASLVVFALEHVHQASANDELRLHLVRYMSTLVKHMNSVRDPHHREKFHDIILFILKITISIVNQVQSPSVSRLAFAYPDAADLQEMEREFNNRYNELQFHILLSILQNVPHVATPSIESYSPTAVGIEDTLEEVKAKLKMGDESRRVVAVSGMGRIGKTILATEVVNSLSSDIEAAYAYCRLDMDIKSTNIVHLQRQLLQNAFNWNVKVDSSNDGRTKILQKLEGNAHASSSETSKPLFLFIDNALKEDDVRELLPIDRLCLLPLRSRILVTTRNLNKIQPLMKIKGFDSEEYRVPENPKAKKMLCQFALVNEDSAFQESVEVEGLLEICGGIPLVIEMAGMDLRKSQDMARTCRDITENIRRMREEGWEEEVSHRLVDFVYGQLPVPAKRVLHDIAFFYVGWNREEVEYMLEAPTFIQKLIDAALLSEDDEGSLKMHDIIRERSHVFSAREGGHRISDEHAWEMAKEDPETWKMIKGVRLDNMFSEVTQHDFDVITKCTAITTLHLFLSGAFKQPWLKLHLWPSLRIVSLTGRIIVNVDQLSPTNLVTLKLDEVMVEDTPRFYQRIGHFHKLCCLELVALEHERAELGSFGERAELGSSGELSSLRRLWLRSYHSQRLPKGFENPVGLQSLKLDDCTNLCQLPKGLEKCSHLKKLDLSGCSMLEKAVDSWHHLTFLQQLSMRDCRSLKFIPEDIGRLSKLKTLDISGCEMLQKLPNSFGGLSSLEFLDMTGCKNLECLCESFCKVSKLKEWRITGCKKLQKLPGNFEGLSSLEMLDMAGCRMLECLCESFSKLSKLKILNINYCEKLQQLPRNFEDFSSLEELYMSNCRMLECLCEGFGKLSKLKKLGICFCEKLQEFPDSFGNLSSLEDLDMRWCTGLKYLCDNFGKLSKLKRLDLRGCQMLQKLPNNFGDLSKLEHLSIDGCEKLEQLPEGFGNLLSLENLYMKSCSSLECLCGNFGKLSKLKQLHMANCGSLKTLLESFANLASLKELSLRGCIGLHKLPETMQQMSCLQFLNLKGCKNIQISAEGLPCSLTVIDIRECQCNEFEFTNLLRMQSLFLVVYSPSSRFQECYHYHCLQNNSLPFALPLSGDTSTSPGDKEREIGRSAVGAWVWKGGGSSGFMRMEGDELVWEDAKTSAVTRSGAKIALLMTGLCPYPPEECREALQEAVDEAYKIVWIDCGVWRWNRYVSCSKSEEFRGEVEWDDEDKRRMRKMLQMIPEGCTKRLWTSLFPKNCLVLAFIIVCCLNVFSYINGGDAMLVKGRCRCRCRCRGEEETEEQETFLDVEEERTWKTWEMDDEMRMNVEEEAERIEIPGFGFLLGTGEFFSNVSRLW